MTAYNWASKASKQGHHHPAKGRQKKSVDEKSVEISLFNNIGVCLQREFLLLENNSGLRPQIATVLIWCQFLRARLVLAVDLLYL